MTNSPTWEGRAYGVVPRAFYSGGGGELVFHQGVTTEQGPARASQYQVFLRTGFLWYVNIALASQLPGEKAGFYH